MISPSLNHSKGFEPNLDFLAVIYFLLYFHLHPSKANYLCKPYIYFSKDCIYKTLVNTPKGTGKG